MADRPMPKPEKPDPALPDETGRRPKYLHVNETSWEALSTRHDELREALANSEKLLTIVLDHVRKVLHNDGCTCLPNGPAHGPDCPARTGREEYERPAHSDGSGVPE